VTLPLDQRGQSVTVFFTVVVMALLLVCGLVIDGGRQAAATREAQSVAAAAARAAADAAVGDIVAGGVGATTGIDAGRRLLNAAQLNGTVTPLASGMRVEISTRVTTVFLSVIGISSLPVKGGATVEYATVR